MTSQEKTKVDEGQRPSPLELLLLSSLARLPMYGYQLKLELRYKHAEMWARCDHGQLYLGLQRMEQARWVRGRNHQSARGPRRRVFHITDAGRAVLIEQLRAFGPTLRPSYFDVDHFLGTCWLLSQAEVVARLQVHLQALDQRLREVRAMEKQMRGHMPKTGELITAHRLAFLEGERRFTRKAIREVAALSAWGSYFGERPIESVIADEGLDLKPPE